MFKTILTAAFVLGTASAVLASEADPNLLNRYPSYNGAQTVGAPVAPAFTTRSVALGGGYVAKSGEQIWINRASQQAGF